MADQTIGQLAVVITGVDKTAAATNAAKANLSSTVDAAHSLSGAFNRISDTRAFSVLNAGLATARAQTASLASSIGSSLASAALPLAGGGLAGLAIGSTTKFVSTSRALLKGARDLQMGVPELSAFRNAADLAGVGAAEATDGVRAFGQTIYDAVGGRNAQALAASTLQNLGFRLRDAAGHARTGADALGDLADRIALLNNAPRSQREFARTWGVEEMLPLLRRGRAGLEDFLAQGRRLGTWTREEAEQGARLGREWDQLRVRGDKLATTIGLALVPSLDEAMGRLEKLIQADNGAFGRGLGDRFRQIGTGTASFVAGVDSAVQSTIGWERATTVLEFLLVNRLLKAITGVNLAVAAFRMPAMLARLLGFAPAAGSAVGGIGAAFAAILAFGARYQSPENDAARESLERQRRYDPMQHPTDADAQGRPIVGGQGFGMTPREASQAGAIARPNGAAVNREQEAREAFAFWTSKGFTPAGAAAMVAQEQGEGGLGNAGARGDGNRAHGLFQHHPDRRRAILNATGIDISTATAAQQREAMYQEMRLGLDPQSGRAFGRIRDATSASAAARVGVEEVERPRDTVGDGNRRAAIAEDWLRRLAPSATRAPGAAAPATPATTPDIGSAATPSAPAPSPAPAAPVRSPLDGPPAPPQRLGSADINVNITGAPRGTTSTVRSDGLLNVDAPRVETAMWDRA